MKKNKLMKLIGFVIFSLFFSLGASHANAQIAPQWTPPPGAPSDTNNVWAPINVGTSSQAKGSLGVMSTALLDVQGWFNADDITAIYTMTVGIPGAGKPGYIASNNTQKGSTGVIAKINKFLGLENVSLFKTQKAFAVEGNGEPNIQVGEIGPAGLCNCQSEQYSCIPLTGACVLNVPTLECTTVADCAISHPGANACVQNHCVVTGGLVQMPPCGTAEGKITTTAPTTNLCGVGGIPSNQGVVANINAAVTGVDYWGWKCVADTAFLGTYEGIRSCYSNLKIDPVLQVNGFSQLNGSSLIKGNLNVNNDLNVEYGDIKTNYGELWSKGRSVCMGNGDNCMFYQAPPPTPDPNSRQWGGTFTKLIPHSFTSTVETCPVPNFITNSCSCPAGFTSYKQLQFLDGSSENNVIKLYGCYK